MPSYNAMSDNIYNYDENGEPYTDNYQDGCYQVHTLLLTFEQLKKVGGNGKNYFVMANF